MLLNIDFKIHNLWAGKFKNLWSRGYGTPFKNKFIELELYKYSYLVGFHFYWYVQTDHPGVDCEFSLFGYTLHFKFYDSRHKSDFDF